MCGSRRHAAPEIDSRGSVAACRGMTERSAPILPPMPDVLRRAADALRRGGLVGLPTETVYGLAARASDDRAVARLYEAKSRPRFNPLIAHVVDRAMAESQALFTDEARCLADRFWPGPLTLVLPVAPGCTVCSLARAGLDTLALRVPGHPAALDLIAHLGEPLVAPSANRSGRISPTSAAAVADEVGAAVEMIVDGGACRVGLESTVIACTDGAPIVLRQGGVTLEAIADTLAAAGGRAPILGHSGGPGEEQRPMSPGQSLRHYAPEAKLRLNAQTAQADEALLGFGAMSATLNLSERADLAEAAANLFSMLRRLDRDYARIAVAPIPAHGLGAAINDRLERAAAGSGAV